MNGVDLGDSLDSNGRGLAFGSGKTMFSSAGTASGKGMALSMGELERFRSLEASDSVLFSWDIFGSSLFSSFDLQFSSIGSVSICTQIVCGHIKRTISGTTATAVGVGGVATVCHRNLVLLINMAAPHAFRIHSCIGTTTKGTPQARFLALRPGFTPAFLEVLFLCRAPTPGRFELSRIWNGSRIAIGRRGEIQWVQKPVFVLRHDIVCETLGVLLGVRETRERGVEEYGIWVRGRGVHGVHDMG